MAKKVLIAGETGNHCLEMAYQKAFADAGHTVALYDTKKAVWQYARGGHWGYQLHRFFTVEAWVRKANKNFCEFVKAFRPDILMVFTGAEILPGSFAYIKSILPNTKIVWYWADPLPNLTQYIYKSLVFADLLASYSKSSLAVFGTMGAKKTCWLPFAGDVEAHFKQAEKKENYPFDISFIGSWRPEREAALKTIHQHFPFLQFKICGPYWHRCKYKPIRKIASSQPIYGKFFTEVVQQTFLNLNVIDTTNYPAANMRFFEIISAGGLQLCSATPEMEVEFQNRKQVLCFNTEEAIVETIQHALNNRAAMEDIKIAGQQLLLSQHLYLNRVAQLLPLIV
jgi:spore maturation protein CgeB